MAAYLVTGAAGFIGARVAELLLGEGQRVIGLDNLNNAYDVRMKEYRLRRLQAQPGFTFQRLEIGDYQALQGYLETVLDRLTDVQTADTQLAAIIHLAARAGVRQSVENPWVFIDTNVTGTLNLLEICRQLKIPKFILASTSSVYGADAPLPTSEEASSDRPLQVYAASKKSAEALCHAYHHLNGLDVTVFRFFTVYGPAGRPDMSMFRFTKWISEGQPLLLNGDGEQSRGFTYVDDIVRGVLLGRKPLGYEIINLGGHESIKMNELIHKLEMQIGKQAIVRHLAAHPADMLANLADVQKARRLLGWVPQVSLDEGIANLVRWYQQERAWASQLETG